MRKVFDAAVIVPLYRMTEILNWRLGKAGPGPIWYADRMQWMRALEENWPVVLDEFERFRARLDRLPDLEDLRTSNNVADFGGGSWGFLYLRLNGTGNAMLAPHFPRTLALLETHVPELFSVRFSLLGGDRKEITPHRDGHCQSIICHLPLIVPEGECSITIAGRRQPWTVGKCFAFDASALHSVQKESKEERLVVLIDTFRPVPFWLRGISRAVFRYTTRKAPVAQIMRQHDQAVGKALAARAAAPAPAH
ncbi:aspartyl/asparaginyl beta-hydroxylase domain-containing protein [Pseudoduganella rivuli]|nr:aspartyl/asparaginyl beta-hydroxylase domain-containing protein [Pseudoduganella rivuli]